MVGGGCGLWKIEDRGGWGFEVKTVPGPVCPCCPLLWCSYTSQPSPPGRGDSGIIFFALGAKCNKVHIPSLPLQA